MNFFFFDKLNEMRIVFDPTRCIELHFVESNPNIISLHSKDK